MQNERIGGIKAAAPKNIEELKLFIKLQLSGFDWNHLNFRDGCFKIGQFYWTNNPRGSDRMREEKLIKRFSNSGANILG